MLLAYPAYLPAEAIHASGVLAAVSPASTWAGTAGGAVSARSRLQSGAFWETLVLLVDAGLFVLVGLCSTRSPRRPRPLGRLALTGLAVVGIVMSRG